MRIVPYHTEERTILSMRGWKRPLYTSTRVYRTEDDVRSRIRCLAREYGRDNVVHMPKKGDPCTELVYVRIN